MPQKKLWVCRDRTGTYISNSRPFWDKDQDWFESGNGGGDVLIEVPKIFAKGLKYGQRRKIVGLILEEE